MTIPQLLGSSWAQLGAVVLSTVAIYGTVILGTRFLGLRTFAKMSSFDFAATIATGSILAGAATGGVPLTTGMVAIAVLFLSQGLLAKSREVSVVKNAIDNSPVLLMDGPTVLEDNLHAAKLHTDDLRGKLREANVMRLDQVAYVVLETTGDISVLHSADKNLSVDDFIVENVPR